MGRNRRGCSDFCRHWFTASFDRSSMIHIAIVKIWTKVFVWKLSLVDNYCIHMTVMISVLNISGAIFSIGYLEKREIVFTLAPWWATLATCVGHEWSFCLMLIGRDGMYVPPWPRVRSLVAIDQGVVSSFQCRAPLAGTTFLPIITHYGFWWIFQFLDSYSKQIILVFIAERYMLLTTIDFFW